MKIAQAETYQRVRGRAEGELFSAYAKLQRRDTLAPPETWPIATSGRAVRVRWPRRYEWAPAGTWVDGLRRRFAEHVPVVAAEIEQPYKGTVLIEVELGGRAYEVAIDYHDGDQVAREVAERCPVVFKMQYREAGYGWPHVLPGGYVAARPQLYRYLPAVRRIRDVRRARFEVYGRFGLSYATEVRRAAVGALQAQQRFNYEGRLKLLPFATYLREAALSRVCLDLPGNGDMAHRLVDYLAIGCCVVRPKPRTRLHVPLTDGLNVRYVEEDLSDLVDVCEELVMNPARTGEMGRAARDYFNRYLHVDQLANYYLRSCISVLDQLGAEAAPPA